MKLDSVSAPSIVPSPKVELALDPNALAIPFQIQKEITAKFGVEPDLTLIVEICLLHCNVEAAGTAIAKGIYGINTNKSS